MRSQSSSDIRRAADLLGAQQRAGEHVLAFAVLFSNPGTELVAENYQLQVAMEDRDLILHYGYVSGRLEAALRRWPKGPAIRLVGMTGAELHLLIGDLSDSFRDTPVRSKRSVSGSADKLRARES